METQPAPEPEVLFERYAAQLAELAQKAVAKGKQPKQVVCVLVDVDDPVWGEFAESLGVSTSDQQAMRDRGERPVRIGSFIAEIVPHIVEVDHALAVGLWTEASHDVVRTVVMSSGRAIVRYLTPAATALPS